MSKCYDNPDYDDTSSDIQNTWNQHHKVEQELKKNFYCGDKVDYDEQCSEQCDGCVDSTGVDYGHLPEEIQPEQIWNAEKKEGIKKLIQKHKITTMMEQDEQLGLYEETKCHCELELDCKDCSQSLEDCTCIEDTIDMKQSTKDRILSETSEEIKQRVRDTANKLVMKQETLEEVAKRYDGENAASGVKSFIAGAKWQQERSYSEEDLMSAFLGCWLGNVPEGVECKLYFDQWFEQFKKK
jgi:hypothetical protein